MLNISVAVFNRNSYTCWIFFVDSQPLACFLTIHFAPAHSNVRNYIISTFGCLSWVELAVGCMTNNGDSPDV